MTSQIASEAEEIAEIERDWNAFDLRALLVKLSNEEDDMKDVTLRLKVSELRKDAEKSYTVTVDAKLRYGVFLRMTLQKSWKYSVIKNILFLTFLRQAD